MKESFFLPRQAHALELEHNYRAGQHEEHPTATGLTVAIAREVGTPAHEVAAAVGARLGWPVHDRELLEQVAAELHMPVRDLERIDERPGSLLLECLAALGSATGPTELALVHRLVGVIRSLAARGQCVIVGRGAALVLPPATTLRVRLVGDREGRITTLSRELHVDRQEAARRFDELCRQHDRFLRNHFPGDPTRAENYDLVLNTSQWTAAECADLIVQALHRKEAHWAVRSGGGTR
jgi:cytidylate kinase